MITQDDTQLDKILCDFGSTLTSVQATTLIIEVPARPTLMRMYAPVLILGFFMIFNDKS